MARSLQRAFPISKNPIETNVLEAGHGRQPVLDFGGISAKLKNSHGNGIVDGAAFHQG